MFEPAIPAYARKQRDGDWRCPNPDCMNHTAGVFGTKMSCPVCGAPRPQTSFQNQGWGQAAPLPPPPKTGMVRYGHVDNFTKLMRACAPKPYLATMQQEPEAAVTGDDASQSDVGGTWLCKCTALNPRIRKRCGVCGATMDEVQLEQSQMEWDDLCKLMQNARKGKGKKSRSRSRKKRKKRKKSSSSSSSSSSSRSSRRRKPKKRGSGGPVELSDAEEPEAERQETKKSNPEIEQAKSEALKRIMSLKEAGLETQERNKQWRALLREWHPDKHENKELATAVFQFLQKAKSLIHTDNK